MNYDRAKLVAELIRDEDERLRWYYCTAHKRSIGVGRNLDDVGISALGTRQLGINLASCIARGITQPQSRVLLGNDIDRTEQALDQRLPWWRKLDGVRQRVLMNMCFNMGIVKLLGFRQALAAMQAAEFERAAEEMADSDWHNQVGDRAIRPIEGDRFTSMSMHGRAEEGAKASTLPLASLEPSPIARPQYEAPDSA
jgi:lysozyme